MRNFIFISLILLFFYSCREQENVKGINTRKCNCPIEDFFDTKIQEDSITKKQDDLIDWSMNGKVSNRFKNLISAELEAHGEIKEGISDGFVSKIVSRINNEYPQLMNETYAYKMKRTFFCAYYTIHCQDTSISNEILRELSASKLEEFEDTFMEYLKNKKNISEEKKYLPTQSSKSEKKREGKKDIDPKEINAQIYTKNQSGGTNTVINQKIDIPEPQYELIHSDKNIQNDGVYYNIFQVIIKTAIPIERALFLIQGSTIEDIDVKSPAGVQMSVFKTVSSSEAKYSFINVHQGVYSIEVRSSKPDNLKISLSRE